MAVGVVALLVVVLLLGVVVAMLRHEKKRGRLTGDLVAAFEAAMDRLGERWTVEGKPDARLPRWTLTRRGRTWEAGFGGGGRGPPQFWITTELDVAEGAGGTPFRSQGEAPLSHPPRVRLRREHRRDRIGKKLHLNRELQLDDPAFDEAVYIESDDDEALLRRVLVSRPLRQSVLSLLASGCDHLALSGDHGPLELRWSGSQERNPFGDAQLDQVMADLDRVAAELPAFAQAQPVTGWPRGARELGLTIGAGFTGMALFAIGVYAYPPLEMSQLAASAIPIGIAVALLVVLMVFFRVRGTSRALRMLGWTAGLGLITWPFFTAGAFMALNGALDSPPVRRNVFVVRTYTHQSKGGPQHYAELRPWPPHEEIEIPLTSGESHRVTIGPRIILVGQGALGVAWYAGLEPK